MILRALYDYYHRCDNLPSFGMELKEIGFIIVINQDGKFLRFEDRRIDKKTAQQFLVKKSVGRSSGVLPNTLYDNSQYVFGYMPKKGDMDKMQKYFCAFKSQIEDLYSKAPNNVYMKALHGFYKKEPVAIIEDMKRDPLWEEIDGNLDKKYSNFSFLLQGDTEIVASKQELFNLTGGETVQGGSICLVSGNKGITARVHSKTPFQGNSFTSLVSFMEGKGYDSYGKSQGANAPVCEEAEFSYTSALNHLLRADSRNKFTLGNRTFLFWASSNSDAAKASEDSLFSLFGRMEDSEDPNRRIELVRQTFLSIYNGQLNSENNDRFYILGLAPNSARIAVVYWAEIPLKEFAKIINRHFDDMEIVDTRNEKKPYVGLHAILGAVTLGGKSTDATPNLPDAIVKSIFQGIPYPASLYQSCLRRVRAEQSLTITRAAIIKAYLNRIDNNTKIQIMLDKENNNQGYLCGRLFAVLENLQYAANKQDTIRSSYMNAASSTPAAVFSTILKLSNSHFGKLAKDKKGLAMYFDTQKEEIIAMLRDFPETLSLQDQGRFFLGYYHQKNYKENNENEE